MGYNIIDIIDNLIYIEEKGYNMFKEISENCKDSKVSIVAKTIANQENKHIQYYENLKENIKTLEKEDIDFFIYDKISARIQQFKFNMNITKMDNVKELINFSIDFEKENLALLIDIQGQLVRKETDTNMLSYNVMGKIINEEKKHIELLNPYYK
ncbi:hypothetical protein ACQX0N_01275 [Clostridium tepidum]|jgi:rubrerythrin|uniref:Rubrerythrin n=1 Tax=Clostridium tepidum TaxID=1962263 RepID=A0A1S9I0W3_9CLOT|nr:hypothetical protein [Clostridium tepidum]MCR1933452.1 hypothetical protein [Clostridium tepidum]MDU6878151.1 hypothetical protein [Clostridium botulinum]OOO61720.1 hypothetical protein BS637_10625 [Clostridium tepidum]OOO63908.1 hypothetical protein BS638_12965 [Clostridium tepidum]